MIIMFLNDDNDDDDDGDNILRQNKTNIKPLNIQSNIIILMIMNKSTKFEYD